MKFLLLILAVAAGMLAPLPAGMNARMGRALGDSFYAALISFAVGTLGLLIYGIAVVERWRLLRGAVAVALAVLAILVLTFPFVLAASAS